MVAEGDEKSLGLEKHPPAKSGAPASKIAPKRIITDLVIIRMMLKQNSFVFPRR